HAIYSRYIWCVDYPKKGRSWSSIRGVKKTSQASRNLSLPCPYFTACVNVSRRLWCPFRNGGLCCFCREAAKPIRTFESTSPRDRQRRGAHRQRILFWV